jgi:hypothetical protein
MNPIDSVLCSEELTTGPYLESDESSSHPTTLFTERNLTNKFHKNGKKNFTKRNVMKNMLRTKILLKLVS